MVLPCQNKVITVIKPRCYCVQNMITDCDSNLQATCDLHVHVYTLYTLPLIHKGCSRNCTIMTLCPSAMPKDVTKAKIACLNFSLQKMKLPLGISVVVQDPDKLQAIRDRCVCVCVCIRALCGCVGAYFIRG